METCGIILDDRDFKISWDIVFIFNEEMVELVNLRKYFVKLCRLMLVCVLGVSATFQGVAYGVRLEYRGEWNRDEGPIVTRDFNSGNLVATLNDIHAISNFSLGVQKIRNTPEALMDIARLLYNGKQVGVNANPIVEIKDVPNRCSNLEELEAVFLRGNRLLTLAPPPGAAPIFNYKIIDLHTNAFLGIMSLTPVYKNNSYGKPRLRCLLVKRWLVTGFKDHKRFGQLLCSIIDTLLQNGILCMIVMDYDADYSGIESELYEVKDIYATLYGAKGSDSWMLYGVGRFEVYPDQVLPTSVTLDMHTKGNDMLAITYKGETGEVVASEDVEHRYVDGYGFLNVDQYKSFAMRLPPL